MSNEVKKQTTVPDYVKFVIGGLAGMGATCVVQPIDLLKNRMQLIGSDGGKRVSSISMIVKIFKSEGPFAFYNGLSAGLLRQASYTTVRMGVYNSLEEKFSVNGTTPFLLKLPIGAVAGATAAFVGNPAEVSLIRMTADGRLPLDQRRNYKSVFNAISRIVREERFFALWTGCTPNIGRCMVVNVSQLVSYSQAKERLMATGYFHEGILMQFCASMISGLITTIASMPLDIAKTRLQNMKVVEGKPQYKGAMDVLLKVVQKEGFFCLWRGFLPYYLRIGPHTVLTFLLIEQMNSFYKTKVA